MRNKIAAAISAVLFAPALVFAFPFGGQINQIIFCYNNAIYTNLGPPRGGPFIWTPSTRTYRFGPPMRTGQWLLGLAAPPYYCIVSKQPIIVWSGILMTMEGSSGAPAPAYQAGQGASGLGGISGINGGGFGTNTGSGSAGVNHILVSEAYPLADGAHGGDSAHQWMELFNPTTATATLSHWVVQTSRSSYTIPNGTLLGPKQYLIVAGAADVRAMWTIPAASQVLVTPDSFGGGFGSAGDRVRLLSDASSTIDAVSWGADATVLAPAAISPATGHSLIRSSLARDLDTAGDWVDTSAPTPGR
jgi:hypothetical protein